MIYTVVSQTDAMTIFNFFNSLFLLKHLIYIKGNKEQWVLIKQHSGLSNWLDIKIRSMNVYFLKLLKEQKWFNFTLMKGNMSITVYS